MNSNLAFYAPLLDRLQNMLLIIDKAVCDFDDIDLYARTCLFGASCHINKPLYIHYSENLFFENIPNYENNTKNSSKSSNFCKFSKKFAALPIIIIFVLDADKIHESTGLFK